MKKSTAFYISLQAKFGFSKLRFILVYSILLVLLIPSTYCQSLINSCPSDFNTILCEPWIENLYNRNNCSECTNNGTMSNFIFDDFQIGYYYSPSYSEIYYYERIICSDPLLPGGSDVYYFYDCNSIYVETYSAPIAPNIAVVKENYFPEFGVTGASFFPPNEMIKMYACTEGSYPDCNATTISPQRDFCLIDPRQEISFTPNYICGEDGNIYLNEEVANICYGVEESTNPMDCNFLCNNGQQDVDEEAIDCGGAFCPPCMESRPFISTWKTDTINSTCNSCITIPTFPGETYNFDVDWESDGIYDEFGITSSVTHDYNSPGTYTISIRGTFPRIYFNGGGDKDKILSIDQWGDIEWTSMEYAFAGCGFLNSTAIDTPDFIQVLSLSNMFSSAASFNGDISHWDVSNITDMSGMFQLATVFNSDLSNWDVSKVQSMGIMFGSCKVFNSDLSNWNTNRAKDMSGMFQNTDAFNADLSSWSVNAATTMAFMFTNAIAFDQNLGAWQLRSINSLEFMLSNSNLSCENYSSTLEGWAANSITPNGLVLGAEGMQYNESGETARNTLISKGWQISGDEPCFTTCSGTYSFDFPSAICSGEAWDLTFSIQGGNPPYAIEIMRNGALIVSEFDNANGSITFNNPPGSENDVFTAFINDADGCTDFNDTSPIQNISVEEGPNAAVSFPNGFSSVEGTTIEISAIVWASNHPPVELLISGFPNLINRTLDVNVGIDISIPGIPEGSYNLDITVTDSLGCVAILAENQTYTVLPASSPVACNLTIEEILCLDVIQNELLNGAFDWEANCGNGFYEFTIETASHPTEGDLIMLYRHGEDVNNPVSELDHRWAIFNCSEVLLEECELNIFSGPCMTGTGDLMNELTSRTVVYTCGVDQLPQNCACSSIACIAMQDVTVSNGMDVTITVDQLVDNFDASCTYSFDGGALVNQVTFTCQELGSQSINVYNLDANVNCWTTINVIDGGDCTSGGGNCFSTTDSILCSSWLNDMITSGLAFCIDPGTEAAYYQVFTTQYNGAPAILVESNINCINPSAFGAGFSLYTCDGFKIEECAYETLGMTTCSNPPLGHPVIGPAYSIGNLIFDSRVSSLPDDCGTLTCETPICLAAIDINIDLGDTYTLTIDQLISNYNLDCYYSFSGITEITELTLDCNTQTGRFYDVYDNQNNANPCGVQVNINGCESIEECPLVVDSLLCQDWVQTIASNLSCEINLPDSEAFYTISTVEYNGSTHLLIFDYQFFISENTNSYRLYTCDGIQVDSCLGGFSGNCQDPSLHPIIGPILNDTTQIFHCRDDVFNCGDCVIKHPKFDVLMTIYAALDGPNWGFNDGWKQGASGQSCDPCNWNGGAWDGITCDQDKITNLNLTFANLKGSIPLEIGQLNNLIELDLAPSDLIGSIPVEIGDLVLLQELRLNDSNLSGPIPIEIGNLINLEMLWFQGNALSDTIPASLGNLINLNNLLLQNNDLEGCIPEEMNNLCPNVTDGNLSNNPNLSNQDWTSFCATGLGICSQPCPNIEWVDVPKDITINCDQINSIKYELFYTNGGQGSCEFSGNEIADTTIATLECDKLITLEWTKSVNGTIISAIQNITVTNLPMPSWQDLQSEIQITCNEIQNINTSHLYTNGELGICNLSASINAQTILSENACNEDRILIWNPLTAIRRDSFNSGINILDLGWVGDVEDFILSDSVLRLDAINAGSSFIYVNETIDKFSMVEVDFNVPINLSAQNFIRIYFLLQSPSINDNGYFIQIGENGSPDEFVLYESLNGSEIELARGVNDRLGNEFIGTLKIKFNECNGSSGSANFELSSKLQNEDLYQTEIVQPIKSSFNKKRIFGIYSSYTESRTDAYSFDNFVIKTSNLSFDIGDLVQKIEVIDCFPFEIRDEFISVRSQESQLVDLLDNDIYPVGDHRIKIRSIDPLVVDTSLSQDGDFNFKLSDSFFDTIRVVYEVCDTICGGCDTATLFITDEILENITPTTVFSPNDDGKNDRLRFSKDDFIEDSELWVYNRWGDQIYHEAPYINSWKADGIPSGVYFYVLKIKGAELKKTLTILK